MAKKVLLRDWNNDEVLPITRGELVLDSSGKEAFRSNEFLATTSQPGLMSSEDKFKIDNIEGIGNIANDKVKQVNTTTSDVYRLLFSETATDETKTEGARKSAKLTFNPSTGVLQTTALIGNLDGTYVNKLTGYNKATTVAGITSEDSLSTALGKLELKADTTYDLVRGAYDGDGTIENLAEILKVLEGISDTETIQAIVGKYLPLSGGKLESHSTNVLTLNSQSPSDTGVYLRMEHNGEKTGEFGCGWGYGTYMWCNNHILRITSNGAAYVDSNTLLHSGNANKTNVPWAASNILFPTGTSATWNIHSNNGYKGITVLNAVQAKPEGAPDHYAVGLSVSGYYGFTLASLGGGDVLLYRRGQTDWKQIAFTSDLENYLPLSGGKTITGNFTLADKVNILNSTKYGFIVFDGTNNMFGAVNSPMILRTNDSAIVHQRGNNNYYIIDSGNVGSQIVEGITTHTGDAINADGDIAKLNSYYSSKGFRISRFNGLNGLGTKNSDGLIINWPLDYAYGQQWYMDDESHTIQTRHVSGGTWSDWKTIAFTDSTVKAAKTLVTDNGGGLAYFANNTFYVGDTIYPNYETHILGYNVVLRSSPSAATGFILNSSGNVTIGQSDLAGTSAKFVITGNQRIYRNYSNDTYLDITVGDVKAYYNGYDPDGWMSHYFQSNGITCMSIIGNSGNVGIGTPVPQYKLDVNGIIHASEFKSLVSNDHYKMLEMGVINGRLLRVHTAAGISGVSGRMAALSLYEGESCYGSIGVTTTGPVWINGTSTRYELLHSGNYNSYSPKLDGTGATGTWGINISGTAAHATSAAALACGSFDTASQITTAYAQWTNNSGCSDVPSMGYAAVLNVGYGNYRWWQIWNSRNDHQLYWRPEKSDASGWADVHILIDNKNITNYLPVVTNYYWADQLITSSAKSNATPTFGNVNIKSGIDAGLAIYTSGDYGRIRFYNAANENKATIHYFATAYSGYTFAKDTLNLGGVAITIGDWNNPTMYITSKSSTTLVKGYVGIGTTSPTQKLHVEGAGVFKNTSSTTYISDGITIGAGDVAQRYITCYGKTGDSYINFGYAASAKNCGELVFHYAASGNDGNYSALSLCGAANQIRVYPGFTKSDKDMQAPRFVATASNSYQSNGGLILNNTDIWGLNAIYTSDLAEGANEGYQFKRSDNNYDSIWCNNGTFYFSPNGHPDSGYTTNYYVLHSGNFDGFYYTLIDASSLDNNTWYPVTMSIGTSYQTNIRIQGHSSANASWNARSDKCMAVILDYTVNGAHWGWTDAQRVVHQFQLGAGAGGSNCIAGIGQLTNDSTEYVYVRGGAKYHFYISRNIPPVLRTSTYTGSGSQTVGPTTSSPTAIVAGYHDMSLYAPHFYENSDANLKKNIKAILDSDNIPVIKEFDWKSDGTHSYGLIAQELEEQGYSELVSNEGDHKTVNYSAALSLIVGKLQVKIKELEKEIENLKKSKND